MSAGHRRGRSVASEPQPFEVTGELPSGTTLLEASAGTGKTWTIASLVTRYVAEGRCRLDQMLVITFGRAASQELRERVREQLVAAERLVAAGSPDAAEPAIAPLAGLLLEGGPDAVAERSGRLRAALADFDAATIATTHQFCQLVLAGLGVAGDTDPGATLVEDLDDLLVEVVDDLYVRGFVGQEQAPEFDRDEALAIARTVVYDPQAGIAPVLPQLPEPEAGSAGEPAGAARGRVARRVGYAEAVRREMDVRKRRGRLLGYDDLLSQLADALCPGDGEEVSAAQQRMRQRWQLVLVDEFQDTDPVQWDVIRLAFHGHATVVLIGDPKQAIYAFRGGDVVTYLRAARSATRHATLAVNHRSDAPLVAAVHALIGGAALGDAQILVREVGARYAESRLHGAPHDAPLRLRMVPRELVAERTYGGKLPIDPLRRVVADDLARDVGELLGSGARFAGRALQPRDVAVLCSTHVQVRAVREGFARHRIPAVVARGGTVFGTEAAHYWRTLLAAMAAPQRSGLVRAAALTPFFGYSAEDLVRADGLVDACADRLRDWRALLTQRGVAAVLEAAGAGGAMAARVLRLDGGDRLMTDLRHAGEALHTASRDLLGVTALLAWMRRQMADDLAMGSRRGTIAAERSRRLDSDAAAVQILTIHGSKGLQFPVVYLPGVADQRAVDADHPLYHDDNGGRFRDIGGAPTDDVRDRARREEADEDLRLLYVALTRAQSQVVAWWLPSGRNTETSPLHRVLFGRLPTEVAVADRATVPSDDEAWRVGERWQEAGAVRLERVGPPAPRPATAPGEAAGEPGLRRFSRSIDRTWARTSYTALTAAAEAADAGGLPATSEPEDPPRDDEPPVPAGTHEVIAGPGAGDGSGALRSPMADLPVGATFGSLVHAVLEHVDPAAADLRGELLEQIAEQRVRWPVDLDAGVLADALVAVLETPLGPLAGTTLRQVGTADRMCELDFELPLGGGDDPVAGSRLRGLGELLRRHLPDGDPVRAFADVVDRPGYDRVLRGFLTGSLDVVIRAGGRYLVADYKTNWLGSLPDAPTSRATGDAGEPQPGAPQLSTDDYRPDRLAAAMGHSTYPLQALLYAVVLHRFLRWRLPGYDPEAHLGGVLYLYVRGMAGPRTPVVDGHPCGVFSWRPPAALIEEISLLLDGAR